MALLTSPPDSLLGARTPRVEHRPGTEVGTHGDLAADLMQMAKKPLEPWQRESVDLLMSYRADGRWACRNYCEWVARQNGKGGIGEARTLAGFFVLGEELITWTAHEYKTAHEAFRRIKKLITKLGTPISDQLVDMGDFKVKISNGNEEGFERLDTGARIIFIARSKSSGRGFTGDLIVIDEAFAFTPDQQDALAPTLVAVPNAQVLYLSSPPLSGDTGEVMYGLRDRADEGRSDRLGYRDWGLAADLDDRDTINLDDPELWASTNPALGNGRVTLESIGNLREEMRSNRARGFAREVLGMWPRRREQGGVIDMTAWGGMKVKGALRSGDAALAVDIAPNRDFASIAMFTRTEDGAPFVRLVAYKRGTDWLVPELVRWRDQLDPVGIAVGRGTGASIATDLEKVGITVPDADSEPKRGDLCVMNSVDMSAATGQFIDAVKQGSFQWVDDEDAEDGISGHLLDAVRGAQTRVGTDSIVWSRKDAKADISPLVAVCGARWLFGEWAHLVDRDDNLPPNVW